MEFFEKAHVVDKCRESMKSKEKVKTQLKQMLYGYKYNDNELVDRFSEPQNNLDDSSSVSGFSDLNLTDYSSDDENSQEASQSIVGRLTDVEDLTPVENRTLQGLSNIIEDSRELDEETDSNISISEFKDGSSLTDDVDSLQSSEPSIASNFLSESTVSMSMDTEESEFDADGALASRILERLNKEDLKRKIVETNYTPKRKESKLGEKSPRSKNSSIPSNSSFRNTVSSKQIEKDLSSSQPYESVIASETPVQSLSDVLGSYIHPTVRNISIENNENLPSFIDNLIPTDSITEEISINDDYVNDLDVESENPIASEAKDNIHHINNASSDDFETNSTLPSDNSIIVDNTETIEEERQSSIEPTDNSVLNSVRIFYGKKTCIMVMKHPAVIYFHGKVKMAGLGGTVEVLGHVLGSIPCKVFAPNYNVAITIKTLENGKGFYGLFGKLTALGLTVSEAENIVTSIGPNDGVISLEPIQSKKYEFINNNFSVTDLFKVNKNVENCFKKASDILECSLYLTKPWKCFEESSYWKQALKYGSEEKSRGIICGGKGAGKSSFLRYYVNKMLEKGPILVIDLDPGQCEFTVAGNISATVVKRPLLGPSFTHLLTPDRMLNIGMINTMDNTKLYMNAVESLITYCNNNKDLREMPWIVNTMGMSNGIGVKFMVFTILHTRPTFFMQIDGKNAKKNFECYLSPNKVRDLYVGYKLGNSKGSLFRSVEPPDELDYSFFVADHSLSVNRSFSLAPRDERYLNFLAYFSSLVNQYHEGLLDIIPYEVRMQDLKIAMNVNVDKNSVMKVINGKVVALCKHRDETYYRDYVKLKDKPMLCLGHGLIRGVDTEKGLLYIITPVPIECLGEVNTLLYADWVPELRGYETQAEKGSPIPYRTASRYDQRELMFPPRRRFNPLQLLKMNRSA